MPRNAQTINGNDLLYRLFLELLEDESEVGTRLLELIIHSYSIWFPKSLYTQIPVLLPWVVRDAKCRPHSIPGQPGKRTPDEWGSPNVDGFQRDDNSLIKGLKSTLVVSGPKLSPLTGTRLANGFVASHVWREVELEELASKDPRLNSFVPNLVWLPAQIAKLSDREGGPVQEALKKASREIYLSADVPDSLRPAVDEIWGLLPESTSSITVDTNSLHWFAITTDYLEYRMTALRRTAEFCEAVADGSQLPRKGRISTRYYEGLPAVDPSRVSVVARMIREFTSF